MVEHLLNELLGLLLVVNHILNLHLKALLMLVRVSRSSMEHVLVASLLLLCVLVLNQLHHLSLLFIHFCGGPLVRTVSAKLDGETNLRLV